MSFARERVSATLAIFSKAITIIRKHGLSEFALRSRNAFPYYVYRCLFLMPYELYLRGKIPSRVLKSYIYVFQLISARDFYLQDPISVTYVDPDDITGCSPNRPPIYWGNIESGEWDQKATCFDERPAPKSIYLHYEQGVPWDETPLRQYFDEMVERRRTWSYTSPDEFDQRVEDIESLVDSIRANGFESRAEQRDPESTEPLPSVLDEVTIDIGRDGRYMYRNLGQHRIAIAKLLGIERIPVLVATRHAEYVDEEGS